MLGVALTDQIVFILLCCSPVSYTHLDVYKRQIEYSYLVQDNHIDCEQLDEIVDLIVDTVCSARKVIRLSLIHI